MLARFLKLFAVLALLGMPVAGSAAPAASGIENLGTRLSDDSLDQLRGKFVAPSGIAYFGIAMSSSWQGTDGITTAANLVFSIDYAKGGAVPLLMVSWSRTCDSCGDDSMDVDKFAPSSDKSYVALAGNGSAIPIGALGSTTGVVQSQQVAGSDNQSRNSMSIQIVPAGSGRLDTSGMSALPSGGATEHFSDGDTIQFAASGQQLGLLMTDQNGSVQQSVNGGLGQLAQHILISGNGISANNAMNLMIGVDPAAASQHLSLQAALQAIKGTGF
jgi:hypothetical protein